MSQLTHFINRKRTWWEYCVAGFGYDNDDLVPIRMNFMFFLVSLLSTVWSLDIEDSTLFNLYWLRKIFHLSLEIEVDVFPLTFFCWIIPHFFIIDKKTQSWSRNNSHKLPIPLSDILYQYDGDYKLSIEEIKKANTLWALVNE